MEILDLPLTSLITTENIRNADNIADLAASMSAAGQEVEIRVFEFDNHPGLYVVKAGHRRVEAAKQLGWKTIRAIVEVEPPDEARFLIGQFNENNHRENMDYMTKVAVFSRLVKMGLSQGAVAAQFGTTQAEVSLALSMARAHPKLQQAVNDGRLSPSAAEPLLPLSNEEQETLVDAAIGEKTVRRVKSLVEAHKVRQGSMNQASNVADEEVLDDPYDEMVIEELSEALKRLSIVSVEAVNDIRKVVSAMEVLQGRLHELSTKLKEKMDERER